MHLRTNLNSVSHVEEEGEPGGAGFLDGGWHVQVGVTEQGRWPLFERHKSRTGLGDGWKVGDVTESAAGTALSAFLSAPWHQGLLTC